jgi:hypothetical protein
MKTVVDQHLRDDISAFYADPENIRLLFQIHPIHIGVSIRLIHFYFDQYCLYNYPHIHTDWISEFKKHRKVRFDFYARGEEKVLVLSPSGIVIESTWSQLNFFKWCIVTEHYFPSDPDLIAKVTEAHKVMRALRIKGTTRTNQVPKRKLIQTAT